MSSERKKKLTAAFITAPLVGFIANLLYDEVAVQTLPSGAMRSLPVALVGAKHILSFAITQVLK